MTDDEIEFEEDMIVCPHCNCHIAFDVEVCDGRSIELKGIRKTTKTEFNLWDEGR